MHLSTSASCSNSPLCTCIRRLSDASGSASRLQRLATNPPRAVPPGEQRRCDWEVECARRPIAPSASSEPRRCRSQHSCLRRAVPRGACRREGGWGSAVAPSAVAPLAVAPSATPSPSRGLQEHHGCEGAHVWTPPPLSPLAPPIAPYGDLHAGGSPGHHVRRRAAGVGRRVCRRPASAHCSPAPLDLQVAQVHGPNRRHPHGA